MSKMMTFEKFIVLLRELDKSLSEKGIFIKIKAIGGFAMIYWAKEYKQTGRTSSRDIDSLYRLPESVVKLIALIGAKEGVEENWLNNDWLTAKKDNEELEYFADWRHITEYNFSNIELYILDLETLFFFKMRAIDDKVSGTTEPPRIQDIRDVYLILRIFDEHDIYHIKNSKMGRCINYFPFARDFMSGREP